MICGQLARRAVALARPAEIVLLTEMEIIDNLSDPALARGLVS